MDHIPKNNQDEETQRWDLFQKGMAPMSGFPQVEVPRTGAKQNDDGLGCGFMVEKIELDSYMKAVSRDLVPFAAFFPFASNRTFVLKIANLNNDFHLLVPATKDEVLEALTYESSGSAARYKPDHEKGKVTIVAFVKQTFIEANGGSLVVSIEPATKIIDFLDILHPKEFTDYAVIAPNGSQPDKEGSSQVKVNSKEKETEKESKENEDPSKIAMPTLIAVNLSPPPPPITSNSSGKPGSHPKEGAVIVLNRPRQITIKQEREVVEEVIQKLQNSGLHTPESKRRIPVPQNQETPRLPLECLERNERIEMTPEPQVKRRSYRSRVKTEPIEDDADDEIPNDPTYAPIKPPPRTQKKRGRPRKLIFDDCEPEPKSKRVK